MSYLSPAGCKNDILSGLSADDFAGLSPHLVPTRVVAGETLVESGGIPDAIYFLEAGLAAVTSPDAQGVERLEVALIGSEGFVTPTVLLGCSAASYNSVVMRLPGRAYRLPVRPFRTLMKENEPFRARIFQATEVFCAAIQQSLTCTMQHPLIQRLARHMLQVRDATNATLLEVSHKDLAHALGTQRPAVTHALGILEQQGLVRLERGMITIVDIAGLEGAVCGCYDRLKRFSERTRASR